MSEEDKHLKESGSDMYGEGEIRSLEGVELIRRRPTLFIDGLDADGLHRLVIEAIDNAVDEFSAGHGREVTVSLLPDGAVEVSDSGRGIPLGDHPELGIPIATVLMTKAFAGAKFDGSAYGTSGGLHGVGLKCINAFSTRVEITSSRPPQSKKFVFENGTLSGVETASSNKSGVNLKFWPDYGVFAGATLDEERIAARLEDLSFLNPGLTLTLNGRARSETYHSDTGVQGLLETKGCTNVFSCRSSSGETEIECHLGETPQGDSVVLSYANGIPTTEGGSHLQGAKSGLARAAMSYGSRKKILRESDPPLLASDTAEGCLLVVSSRSPHPPFSSQRKTRVNSPEIEQAACSIVESAFAAWLESSPARARRTILRFVSAARARERLRALKNRLRMLLKAKKNSRPNSLLSGGGQPAELWLAVKFPGWERLSEEGRDVMPMRMKQNPPPTRTSLDKLLRHPDYFNLVSALSAGVGSPEDDPDGGFSLEKCRYRKIVVSSPEVQSSRLAAAFVLLFVERHLPGLLDSGRVFWDDGVSTKRVSLSQNIREELENTAAEEDASDPVTPAESELPQVPPDSASD